MQQNLDAIESLLNNTEKKLSTGFVLVSFSIIKQNN